MTPFEAFKQLIQNSLNDKDMLQTLYNLLLLEVNVTTATLVLRKDFNNEFAQKGVVEKWFMPYMLMTPGGKELFRDELTEQGRVMLDAWIFANNTNYPFREEVAKMYLLSVADKTDEELTQHLNEARTLFVIVQDLLYTNKTMGNEKESTMNFGDIAPSN